MVNKKVNILKETMGMSLSENLRIYAKEYKYLSNHTKDSNIPDILLVAANTIENLSAKVASQNGIGWIPCSERLPEEAFGCIVTIVDTEPTTGEDYECILPYFVGYDGEKWNNSDGEQIPFEVLAWMPLPPAHEPKEERKNEQQNIYQRSDNRNK